jgi:hypothetical protein
MGVLTDFFVAAPTEIDDAIVEAGPVGRFKTVEAKGADDVSLTSLNGIVTDRKFAVDEGFDTLFAEVESVSAASEEDGPWLFRVPPALVAGLAIADEPRLDEINEAWAQTEGWQADGVTSPDETRWIVQGLAELARDAAASNKEMYVWISL